MLSDPISVFENFEEGGGTYTKEHQGIFLVVNVICDLTFGVENGEERDEYETNELESLFPSALNVRYFRFLLRRRPVRLLLLLHSSHSLTLR